MRKVHLLPLLLSAFVLFGFKNPENARLIHVEVDYRHGWSGYLRLFENAEKLFYDRQYDSAASKFLSIAYGETITIEGRWPIQNVALLRAAECFHQSGKKRDAISTLHELLTSNVEDGVGGSWVGQSPQELRIVAEKFLEQIGQSPKEFYRSLMNDNEHSVLGVHSLARFPDSKSKSILKKMQSDTSIFVRYVVHYSSHGDIGILDTNITDIISAVCAADSSIKGTMYTSRENEPRRGKVAVTKHFYLKQAATDALNYLSIHTDDFMSHSFYDNDEFYEIEKWILK